MGGANNYKIQIFAVIGTNNYEHVYGTKPSRASFSAVLCLIVSSQIARSNETSSTIEVIYSRSQREEHSREICCTLSVEQQKRPVISFNYPMNGLPLLYIT